ncbi:hypothetical protein MPTK1_8g02090 [Marchantia polymorpha subsp. ruderalis]|uniref:Uncharacterized protein n=1 Tax=Marchantia polymorpha TaxID=3197 RepID=A0A2R6XIT5_MARPO|nr:hypothetical protein MARPO_0012s0006 [Marchantia polymorpha]BBN18376.1 hypothetical protein Mp_8g02090 [Marchantia polymorpha subsp. ruderalis]|eukprot:PTQ46023.1 hypothetical protein MARPO_0012s0006 [Marchantia polymorpha]
MSSSGLQGGSAVSINLMEVVIVPESKTVYANVVDSEASSRIDLDKSSSRCRPCQIFHLDRASKYRKAHGHINGFDRKVRISLSSQNSNLFACAQESPGCFWTLNEATLLTLIQGHGTIGVEALVESRLLKEVRDARADL